MISWTRRRCRKTHWRVCSAAYAYVTLAAYTVHALETLCRRHHPPAPSLFLPTPIKRSRTSRRSGGQWPAPHRSRRRSWMRSIRVPTTRRRQKPLPCRKPPRSRGGVMGDRPRRRLWRAAARLTTRQSTLSPAFTSGSVRKGCAGARALVFPVRSFAAARTYVGWHRTSLPLQPLGQHRSTGVSAPDNSPRGRRGRHTRRRWTLPGFKQSRLLGPVFAGDGCIANAWRRGGARQTSAPATPKTASATRTHAPHAEPPGRRRRASTTPALHFVAVTATTIGRQACCRLSTQSPVESPAAGAAEAYKSRSVPVCVSCSDAPRHTTSA